MTGDYDSAIEYICDLEALVRWFAQSFSFQDPHTGEWTHNEPIWKYRNEFDQDLPDNVRLAKAWRTCMGAHVATVAQASDPAPTGTSEKESAHG